MFFLLLIVGSRKIFKSCLYFSFCKLEFLIKLIYLFFTPKWTPNRPQQQQHTLDYLDTPAEPERLTPFKFTSNHCSASFQNGLLICAKQKYLPNNEIQNNVNVLKFGKSKKNEI